jgi:hypothetical protein
VTSNERGLWDFAPEGAHTEEGLPSDSLGTPAGYVRALC